MRHEFTDDELEHMVNLGRKHLDLWMLTFLVNDEGIHFKPRVYDAAREEQGGF